MDLIVYSLIVIIVVTISYISEHKLGIISNGEYILINGENIGKQRKKVSIFMILFITLILSIYSAILDISGNLTDAVRYTLHFLYTYPAYYNSSDAFFNAETEIGYLLVNMVVWNFTKEPFCFFLLVAFITNFINLYVASKISSRYTFIVFLYLISLSFFYTTYLLKQTLAVSFANLALLSYLNNMKWRYFLFSFIAISFHATAIILLPMFFVFEIIKSRKTYIFLILCSIILLFYFGTIINSILPKIPYIDQYLPVENMEILISGGNLATIFKGIPFYIITILALFNREKLKNVLNKADFYITCSTLYSISWILSYHMYWFFRMGWYFLLPTLILVPNLFKTVKNKKERILYYTTVIFLFIIITYRQIFITLY